MTRSLAEKLPAQKINPRKAGRLWPSGLKRHNSRPLSALTPTTHLPGVGTIITSWTIMGLH